jgi:alanyl-tRNA synthetase
LPKDKLWATVFLDDDEAEQLWALKTEIPASRIVRLGEKDNFWTMGDVGPCGPCSEVIYDRGEAYRCDAAVCAIGECDCDRWLEIWNLVFMQFEKDADGKLTPLPQPSVDTGMGLERLASILQEVDSNFETDLMKPLIGWLEKNTGIAYSSFESGFPMRVIADHARACTFLIADGVLPSNEGKGYVLRRILRRAVRFGKMLSLEKPFLFKMVDVVVGLMKDAYPEVIEQQDNIKKIIKIEEERFHKTLHEGMKVANSIVDQTKKAGKSYIEGEDAFLLYDTFGFPLDLTKDLAEENNLMLDEKGFVAEMEIQRNRARLARGEVGKMEFTAAFINALGGIPKSQFVGYDKTSSDTKILSLLINDQAVESAKAGEEVFVVLQETPFYPESGGQIGDQGVITTKQGVLEVYDVKKLPDGKIIHLGKVTKGEIKTTDMVNVKVESIRRLDTARNHTATHLLHQALKQVLGEHVNQAGSLITPQRLRFDFTHFERLTEEKIV